MARQIESGLRRTGDFPSQRPIAIKLQTRLSDFSGQTNIFFVQVWTFASSRQTSNSESFREQALNIEYRNIVGEAVGFPRDDCVVPYRSRKIKSASIRVIGG